MLESKLTSLPLLSFHDALQHVHIQLISTSKPRERAKAATRYKELKFHIASTKVTLTSLLMAAMPSRE